MADATCSENWSEANLRTATAAQHGSRNARGSIVARSVGAGSCSRGISSSEEVWRFSMGKEESVGHEIEALKVRPFRSVMWVL